MSIFYLMLAVSVLAITGASIGYGHIYYFWISVIFGFRRELKMRAMENRLTKEKGVKEAVNVG